MQRRTILIGALALVVVVAAIGGVAYVLHTRTPAGETSYPGLNAPVAVVCPGPTFSTTGQGRPAIRPRNDCTPSFTQQDVRDYLAQVRGSLGGFLGVTGRPTVTRVAFLTVGDLNRVGRQSVLGLTYPADMLVCDAELSGRFSVSNVGPNTESAASIVFDAHTGNVLVTVAGPLLS